MSSGVTVPRIRGAPFSAAAFEKDLLAKKFLGRHLILLSRPAGVHRVLVENAANYARPSTAFRILGPPIGGGLFLAEGAEWERQRRLLAPSFSQRFVPKFARDVTVKTQALLDELA